MPHFFHDESPKYNAQSFKNYGVHHYIAVRISIG